MKKTYCLVLLLIIAFNGISQKVEKYCEIIATGRLLSRKVTIDIDYGEERKLFTFKDSRVKDELGKVQKFNSVVDALNYIGSLGWVFVNAFPISTGNGPAVYHFFFKKQFDESELENETIVDEKK